MRRRRYRRSPSRASSARAPIGAVGLPVAMAPSPCAGVACTPMPRPASVAGDRPGHGLPEASDGARDWHPEGPLRTRAAIAGVTVRGLWPRLRAMPPRRAEDGELLLCHSREHLAALEAAAAAAGAAGTRLFMPPGGCFVSGLPVEDQLLSEETARRGSHAGRAPIPPHSSISRMCAAPAPLAPGGSAFAASSLRLAHMCLPTCASVCMDVGGK